MNEHKFETIKTDIKQVHKEYGLSKEDLDIIAKNLAISFKGYPLFEYFANGKYSIKKMTYFWKANLKTMSKRTVILGDSDQMNSLLMFSPYQKDEFSILEYIKCGGIPLIFKMGLKSINKMMSFETLANKIKDKYAHENCWYLYTFVTLPEYRGKGHGSKIIKQMCKYLDEHKQDCYLETLLPINVEIYKKYGFDLKETVKVEDSDLTIYALLRKYQKN